MPGSKKTCRLTQVLKETFGYDSLRPGQDEVVQRLLDGDSTLAIFPTGAGKSLCFQLPALLLKSKVSVVISPLLSLIRDQLTQLEQLGISAASLDSTQSPKEREAVLDQVEKHKINLLYLSPEGLLKKDNLGILKRINIGIVAIDEAHCISEWGHSFRPSYLQLAQVVRRLKAHAILGLTATATKEVARDIRSHFKIKTRDLIQQTLVRPNLHYKVTPTTAELRNNELLKALAEPNALPAIVYVMKQEDAEAVSGFLQSRLAKAKSYHAGMHSDARKLVQDEFLTNKIDVVVATIAFGMGVNKPDIRSVIHYHLPKSPEGWLQESGRAGRDGKDAYCRMLACGDDLIPLRNFVHGAAVSQHSVQRFVERIFSNNTTFKLSNYWWGVELDLSEAQLNIALAHLINEGWIAETDASWRYYQISRLRYDTQTYPRSKQAVVNAVHDHWGKIDTLEAEEKFKVPRTKLIAIINEMVSAGDVSAKKTSKLRHFTIKKTPDDLTALTQSIFNAFQKHSENSFARIDFVTMAATSRSCIPNRLIKYFGETVAESCGKCSSCLGEKRSRKLPSSPTPSISQDQAAAIQSVHREKLAELCTPNRLAKFLCGISSPATRHARLYKHDAYGSTETVPFEDVIAHCEALAW